MNVVEENGHPSGGKWAFHGIYPMVLESTWNITDGNGTNMMVRERSASMKIKAHKQSSKRVAIPATAPLDIS